MRRFADRIDHAGAPKISHWSFTFEEGRGLVFRQDGRGCPVAYLGDGEYARAHSEAGDYPSLPEIAASQITMRSTFTALPSARVVARFRPGASIT
jgi:hypothetical protein